MFKLKFLIIFFLASFSLQFAKAQTPAKADLVANCSVSNPSFPFLTYAPGKSEANAITANVVVTCTNMHNDVPYSLGLSKSKQLFIMNKGTEIMYYQLFTSENHTTLWDDSNTKIDKQLKFADKKEIPFVVILGESEIENKKIAVKNLKNQTQGTFEYDSFFAEIEKRS